SLERAVAQLAAYVSERAESLGQRYTGVLTDGTEWRLYHLGPGQLVLASTYRVDSATPDVDGFLYWLAGVLATEQRVASTAAATCSPGTHRSSAWSSTTSSTGQSTVDLRGRGGCRASRAGSRSSTGVRLSTTP